jgi:hypothetical protein
MRPTAVLFCVGLCLFLGAFEKPVQSLRAARSIRTVSEDFDFSGYRVPVSTADEPGRVVFPYSVIPGGVFDRDELADAVRRDPVVAKHYANFNVDDAHVVRAQNPQMVHVSYRIQNKVFWTAQKVQLAQGEKLISDGQKLARSRCGNQVSAVPQQPVSEQEPPPEVFNTPVIPVDDPLILSETLATPPFPPIEPLPLPVLESLIIPPDLITLENRFFDNIVVPFVPTPYFPPLYLLEEGGFDVPEPSTLILLLSGLAVPVVLRLKAKRRPGGNSTQRS